MFWPESTSVLNSLDTSFKLLSFILTLIIFWKAFQLYKIYSEKSLLYFTSAFFFFSMGNLFSLIVDVYMYLRIIFGGVFVTFVQKKAALSLLLAFRHGFLLLGFISLFFIALGFPNRRVQLAIFLMTAVSGFLSGFKGLFFHVIVTLFAIFIVSDLFYKYRKTGHKVSLMYLIGMCILYLAYVGYVLFFLNRSFYWVGHLLEFMAYVVFIVLLFSVVKNEAKKGKAGNNT